jgi:hypothetical protein
MNTRDLIVAAGIATGLAATVLKRRRSAISFRGQTAFVGGGSRGLLTPGRGISPAWRKSGHHGT